MTLRFAFRINPRNIGLLLAGIACLLAALSICTEYITEKVLDTDEHESLGLVLDLFSVNAEETIPTWYSTLILFVAAALFGVITVTKRQSDDRFATHWLGLAVIFLYLSMDEGAVIHEILSDPLQIALKTTGYLYFGWQIVALPLVIIFVLLYLRFLLHLPPNIRNLFILAGVLYVGGALVVEAISANEYYVDEGITFTYLVIGTVEELCEMLGVVVLIYALLRYMADAQYLLQFNFQTSSDQETTASPPPPPPPPPDETELSGSS